MFLQTVSHLVLPSQHLKLSQPEQQTLLSIQRDAEERHQRRMERDHQADELKLKCESANLVCCTPCMFR